eukprot:m.65944 g.65944  ORF g.65944 m.65944 type:complete len:356 (-) comp18033_c0_seq1:104-1171(-)
MQIALRRIGTFRRHAMATTASGGATSRRGASVAAAVADEMETARFFFDLNGFVIARNALSPKHVSRLNAAVDRHNTEFKSRTTSRPELRNTKPGTPLAGDGESPRRDMGGMLGWRAGDREPFRELLAHPVLSRYLHMLCGEGYRLDHSPLVLAQNKGSEGFHLHGGPITQDGRLNPSLQYHCRPPDIWNSLVAMSVTLTPQPEDAGGFVVVRGSHKINFPVPEVLMHGKEHTEHLHQPTTQPGDVIFFSEATVHGAAQWAADHERRIALYRFAPPELSYGRAGAGGGWPASYLDGCTPAQAAVLEPAYNRRLDRPCVQPSQSDTEAEGSGLDVVVHSRSPEKKAFDREVFGTEFF